MLMRFGMQNHLSIDGYQELSLVASDSSSSGVDLIEIPGVDHKLLPGVVLYGANASGKTNLIHGLRRMVGLILNSHKSGSPTGGVNVSPFALGESEAHRVSKFDCDFIFNGRRYNYGFEATHEKFVREWLMYFRRDECVSLFERTDDDDSVSFSRLLKGQNRVILSLTRPNSLFLSAAAQNAHKMLLEIYKFFEEKIVFEVRNLEIMIQESGEIDPRIARFLAEADYGIEDLKLETVQNPDEVSELLREISNVLRARFPDASSFPQSAKTMKKLSFAHRASGGRSVYIESDMESTGTIRLVELLVPMLQAIDSGATIVIDELDSSLHTLLAVKLIKIFSSRITNPNGAQIVAVTHDTNLLRMAGLRNDQVWFAEKKRDGATVIYPLSDINMEEEDDIESGYLQGRFGGVPFIRDLLKIGKDRDGE